MLHCSVLYGCISLCNIMSLLSLSFCVICLWACYWNKRTDWLIDSSFHVNNINSQLKISTVFTTGSVTAHCVNSTPVNCGVSRHASGVFRIFVRRKTCYLPFLFPSTLVVTCEDSGVPPAGKAAILSPTCIFAHLVANGFPKTVLNLLQPQNDYIT